MHAYMSSIPFEDVSCFASRIWLNDTNFLLYSI
jgi:hypothetical protein